MSKQLYKVQITNHCEAVLRDTAYSIAVDLSAPEEAISCERRDGLQWHLVRPKKETKSGITSISNQIGTRFKRYHRKKGINKQRN